MTGLEDGPVWLQNPRPELLHTQQKEKVRTCSSFEQLILLMREERCGLGKRLLRPGLCIGAAREADGSERGRRLLKAPEASLISHCALEWGHMSRAKEVILALGASSYTSHSPLQLEASARPIICSPTTLPTCAPSLPWVWISFLSFTPKLRLGDSSPFFRKQLRSSCLWGHFPGLSASVTFPKLATCCLSFSCCAEHTLKVASLLLYHLF